MYDAQVDGAVSGEVECTHACYDIDHLLGDQSPTLWGLAGDGGEEGPHHVSQFPVGHMHNLTSAS